uniref:Alkyl hydroperoxide reductase/ Thiol specific antioxidant/ Mal allergen n=1 Tax=Cyanothece sp. (strain PCC 7425 / ATCC 29141) TaxID=395961 RepID=B8HYF9_CYAP4
MGLRIPTLSSSNFTGLVNDRFWKNFLPIPATNQMEIGSATPDFELPDVTHNQNLRLSNLYRQQPVVLAFTRIFTEHQYCPLCLPHIKALNEAYPQFQQQGVEVLLITSTDQLQSQKVVTDLQLNLPLLSNPSCDVFRRYGTGQALGAPLPAQFVIDTQGKLRFKHLFSFFDNNASITTLLQALAS